MAKLKTKPTEISPADYITNISPISKQLDAQWLLETCERLIGEKAKMWGPSIIGSGSYHYKYESGREGDMVLCGFSPRKTALVVYLGGNIDDQAELLEKLGPHKMGRSCLYIKRLDDVDLNIMEALMQKSIDATLAKYPSNQSKNS